MVLNPSDYRLPKPGMQLNPLKVGTYPRLFGMIVAGTLVLVAALMAWNVGVPTASSLISRLTGGRLNARGEGMEVF